MSITKQVTVWCDDCGVWEQETSTVVQLRKKLKKRGWLTKQVIEEEIRDYCPECAKRRR